MESQMELGIHVEVPCLGEAEAKAVEAIVWVSVIRRTNARIFAAIGPRLVPFFVLGTMVRVPICVRY